MSHASAFFALNREDSLSAGQVKGLLTCTPLPYKLEVEDWVLIESIRHKALHTTMPMKAPPHPGDLIRTEIIEPVGLSVTGAAEALGVRRATLSDLLNGKAALTPEMALRIEKAFGPSMEQLLRMQLAYDVAQLRNHEREIKVSRYAPA